MTATQNVHRRAFGLVSAIVAVAAVIGVATACSQTTGNLVLVRSLPGTVTGYLSYENAGFGTTLEIRFTSGTGKSVDVRTSTPVGAQRTTTVVDAGATSPWTTVSALQPPSWTPRVGQPPVVLRLTTTSDTDLPMKFEVRAMLGAQETFPALQPVTATGADCAKAPARTDLTSVNLAGLDLHNCVISGSKLDPAKLAGARLDGADLSGTTFIPGALPGVSLNDARLTSSTMVGVTFAPYVGLYDADLTGANLGNATLQQSSLSGAVLAGTNFTGATFQSITSGRVTGTPTLPAGWALRNGYLIGATANLDHADLHGLDLHGLDFTGTSLREANLTGADLRSTDFAGSILSATTLTGVNIGGAKLAGAHIDDLTIGGIIGTTSGGIVGTPASLPTGWTLAGGYLIGPAANLSGVNLAGVDLHGRDLTLVSFSNANLTGADLTGSNLTNATFTGATVTGTKLAGATLAGVHSRPVTGVPASLPNGYRLIDSTFIGAGVYVDSANLSGANLSGLDLHGINCWPCTTAGTNFTGANLSNSTFYGLDGANLTNADFNGASLTSSINGATITGTKFAGATFDLLRSSELVGQPASLPTGVSVVQGYLVGPHTYFDGTDLHGRDLRNVSFTGTDFSGVNLSGADLRGASFTGAILNSVNLTNTKIDGTNFSTMTSFIGNDLTGATGTPLYANTQFAVSTCPDGTYTELTNTCQGHPWP